VLPGQSVALTWASTNTTSCTASDGWTGTKATSGTETSPAITASTTFTLTCSGAAGSTPATKSVAVSVTPVQAGNVVISGLITFDRIPFKSVGQGLDPNQPVESPARQVTVEALDASNGVVATTSTNSAGSYALSVTQNTQVKIRAKAQMTKTDTAPTWDFKVLNNTNGDALYAIDGALATSGTAASVRNLRAASGWTGTTYVNAQRAAAAFAILDTVYKAKELVRSAVPDTVFPALSLFWSFNNKSSDSFCPDTGDILTSVYFGFDTGDTDECSPAQPGVDGIYILGDYASGGGDTDEFDQHVVAHEFGHYLEDKFSRTDSIGGMHQVGDKLDLRVAFGEGWGDAFSGMALNDPQYKDSQSGVTAQTGFNLESDTDSVEGSYAESSVFQFLWDLFDDATESGDSVNLGFAPIWATFIGPEKTTDALTSIYSYSTALISANTSQASAIRALLTREEIAGNNAFGANETNFANSTATLSPIYTPLTLGAGGVSVCGTRQFGTGNKLGNRRFLTFDLATSRAVRIDVVGEVAGTPDADPDIGLWRRGLIALADNTGKTESLTTGTLTAGTYVIEVADFSHIDTGTPASRRGDTCMTVSVTGL